MAIFNSYVKLPEGNHEPQTFEKRVVTAMWLGRGKINCLLCQEDLRRQLFRCRPQELKIAKIAAGFKLEESSLR